MEGRLTPAQGFDEVGSPGVAQVGDLRGADGADFAAAAGVDGVKLGCDDCWVGGWG